MEVSASTGDHVSCYEGETSLQDNSEVSCKKKNDILVAFELLVLFEPQA